MTRSITSQAVESISLCTTKARTTNTNAESKPKMKIGLLIVASPQTVFPRRKKITAENTDVAGVNTASAPSLLDETDGSAISRVAPPFFLQSHTVCSSCGSPQLWSTDSTGAKLRSYRKERRDSAHLFHIFHRTKSQIRHSMTNLQRPHMGTL